MDIVILSVVDAGANEKKIIWKSGHENDKDFSISKTIRIVKTDAVKKIAYCIVYSPNVVDAHGDYANTDEIEKGCYGFMKKSNTAAVDTQHNLVTNVGCFVGENWIVRKGDALFPEDEGAWAVGIKIENDEIWKKIESGEYTGVSMYGFANRTTDSADDTDVEKGFGRKLMKAFQMVFGDDANDTNEKIVKSFDSELSRLTFRIILDAMWYTIDDIYYSGDEFEDRREKIFEAFDQAKKVLADLEIIKSEKVKGGDLDAETIEKVKKSTESIKEFLEKSDKLSQEGLKMKQEDPKKQKTEKTDEEIKKEKIEKLEKELEELKKSDANDDDTNLKEQVDEMKKEIEELKKQSKGSEQEHNVPEGKEEVSKNVYPFLGPNFDKSN